MNIKKLTKSLYWRISFSFLLILILLGFAYVFITVVAADRHFKETTQRLNANVAESLLQEVTPFVDGQVNEEALGKIMHSMMAVNPSLEVYLVSTSGEILSFVVLYKKVKLTHIDLNPVNEFIQQKGSQYVLGDDPRNPGRKTIFSASGVYNGDELLGYVYMVLASEQYDNITATLLGSYWLRVGSNAFILTLIASFAISLLLIWLVTRNLRLVIQTFNTFEQGDLHARIPEKKMKGEMASLSRTFNNMADTILRNIEELKEVDSLRRELIANVSHDLRSPLAVIHGYIETLLIKEEDLSPAERKKYLKVILDGSDKLKRLVSDLFELSKLEANQVVPHYEKFFISELIADATQHYSIIAEKKNIKVRSTISTTAPMVEADISLMERVVQNLMSNAIKYTPENGEINVKVREEAKGIEVEIENSGEGIKAEDLPHIFDRYYKIDKSKSGIEGTGLGLAIVKKILDLHNVKINVNSISGKSTSFSFSLPL